MSKRWLLSLPVLIAIVWLASGPRTDAVLLTGFVRVVHASGEGAQAPSTAVSTRIPDSWTVPRTPWGDPVLEGIFTNRDEQGIPFERPTEFGEREFVTEGEFAERETQVRQQLELDLADFDVQTAETSTAGQPGTGTSPPPHWNDRGRPSRRTSRIVDPRDGRILPLTPEGRQRQAMLAAARQTRGSGTSYEDFGLFQRCITRGLPGSMMPAVYGNSYQILQTPDYVAIRYEMVHETRIIPFDRRPHLGPTIRQHMGDARGYWDGDTLVVETTNFREESAYRGADPTTLRLIEHFTPVAPDKVEWSVTVDDRRTWTRPWTFMVELTRDESQPVFEYACHEGNYAMFNVLSTARAEEQAAN